MPLKVDEDFADLAGRAEFADGIAEAVVFQLDELRQFVRVQFADAARYVVVEDELEKFGLLIATAQEDRPAECWKLSVSGCPALPCWKLSVSPALP